MKMTPMRIMGVIVVFGGAILLTSKKVQKFANKKFWSKAAYKEQLRLAGTTWVFETTATIPEIKAQLRVFVKAEEKRQVLLREIYVAKEQHDIIIYNYGTALSECFSTTILFTQTPDGVTADFEVSRWKETESVSADVIIMNNLIESVKKAFTTADPQCHIRERRKLDSQETQANAALEPKPPIEPVLPPISIAPQQKEPDQQPVKPVPLPSYPSVPPISTVLPPIEPIQQPNIFTPLPTEAAPIPSAPVEQSGEFTSELVFPALPENEIMPVTSAPVEQSGEFTSGLVFPMLPENEIAPVAGAPVEQSGEFTSELVFPTLPENEIAPPLSEPAPLFTESSPMPSNFSANDRPTDEPSLNRGAYSAANATQEVKITYDASKEKPIEENEIRCGKCGNENRGKNKFCQFCGSTLPTDGGDLVSTPQIEPVFGKSTEDKVETRCRMCGNEDTGNNKICLYCGNSLITAEENAAPPPQNETVEVQRTEDKAEKKENGDLDKIDNKNQPDRKKSKKQQKAGKGKSGAKRGLKILDIVITLIMVAVLVTLYFIFR